jgi:hypothetical protein
MGGFLIVGNTVLDNLVKYKSSSEYVKIKVLITMHRRGKP